MFDKIVVARLKEKVIAEPHIGTIDNDGTYVYKEGNYIVRYDILGDRSDNAPVRIISIKHKISELERKKRNVAKLLHDFFLQYGWVSLFRPRALLFLILGVLIFYLGVIQPYNKKVNRFKSVASKVVGAATEQLENNGGIFSLFGKNKPLDRQEDSVIFSFSPFNLFLSKNTGYISRWSRQKGFEKYPVSFDDSGNVWVGLGNNIWKHGLYSGDAIKWDTLKEIDSAASFKEKIPQSANP